MIYPMFNDLGVAMSGANFPTSILPEGLSVVIPCPPEQFGEFVSGLLGKPQVITKRFSGCFSIKRDDISVFFQLVQHRLNEQQKANLIQFTVTTSYNDGSSVEVSSIAEFMQYAEVRPLIPVAITLTWVYLVQFPQKGAPERQQIDVTFRVFNTRYETRANGFKIDIFDDEGNYQLKHIKVDSYSTGRAAFRVSHTARSWGMDIEGLLTSYVQNIMRSTGGAFREWISFHSDFLGFVSGSASFTLFLFIGSKVLADRWDRRMIGFKTLLSESGDTSLRVQAKLDFIADKLTGRDSLFWVVSGIVYIFVALIISVGVGTFCGEQAAAEEPSFITLSSRSEIYKESIFKQYRNSFPRFLATFLLSVLSSVVASFIFVFIWP